MSSPLWLLCAAALATACGPSAKEVRRAKTSHYTCPEGVVLDAVNAQMRETFGGMDGADEDALIFTSMVRWHSANGIPKQKGPAVVESGDLGFAVAVQLREVERGYGIRAAPIVMSHVTGSSLGRELRPGHADWPTWAQEKTDVFQVNLHKRLKECAIQP